MQPAIRYPALVYENYVKLYLDPKHLESNWIGGGEIFCDFFSKKVPILANISHSPNFLD